MTMLVVLALLSLTLTTQATPVEITDVMGRKVTLEAPARRIVMGAGRQLPVLGLLHPKPASLLVAWRGDFKLDPAQYGDWAKAFPEIDAVPVIGGNAADGLPVETIVTLKPDLVVLSLYDAEAAPTRRSMTLLEELHIPVIVVDFFSHPLENSLPSLKILGRAIGAEARADAFAAFYQSHLDLVRDRLAKAKPKPPRVFMHVHAGGMPCCPTPGHGVFNDMIELAGARNVALAHVPGLYGDVSLERLIADDPDVYVATGGAHLAARGGLVLGPDVSRHDAEASFDKLLANPGLSQLTAVRQGRAFALWHMFNDTPAHIAMIEFLAKAFHPDLFADLDPQATIDAINRDFLPVPMTGTYWVER
ncbi:ABC transporter substrate-binding protein [Ollibium composti]|uniref:ABC transporter substrate-binding protein n=1 Tax=Ollibium composti TaxID=2675109 RepID=UPI0019804514|nr:ABC transporter substrate-binding protein [Mesorhizobium composti]